MATFAQALAMRAEEERGDLRGLRAALRRNGRDIAAHKASGGRWEAVAKALTDSGEFPLETDTPEKAKKSCAKLRKAWDGLRKSDARFAAMVDAIEGGAASAKVDAPRPAVSPKIPREEGGERKAEESPRREVVPAPREIPERKREPEPVAEPDRADTVVELRPQAQTEDAPKATADQAASVQAAPGKFGRIGKIM